MDRKVRIAIIGAGAVADFHHVPGIKLDPRAELAAVCDPNLELLEKRQRDWGPTKKTPRYEDIARDPDIDAAIICTPNYTHLPITMACLEGGKHVMCEKPLGLNFAEAALMYRTERGKAAASLEELAKAGCAPGVFGQGPLTCPDGASACSTV